MSYKSKQKPQHEYGCPGMGTPTCPVCSQTMSFDEALPYILIAVGIGLVVWFFFFGPSHPFPGLDKFDGQF